MGTTSELGASKFEFTPSAVSAENEDDIVLVENVPQLLRNDLQGSANQFQDEEASFIRCQPATSKEVGSILIFCHKRQIDQMESVFMPPGQPWQEEDHHPTEPSLNGTWLKFNKTTKTFKSLIDHETVYRWYTNAAVNRQLEESAMYAELRPMKLDKYTSKLTGRSNERSAEHAAMQKLFEYLSNLTFEETSKWRHIYHPGQSLTSLGVPHVCRYRLPRRRTLLLHTLFFGSCAGMLLSGVHLPGGMRTVTGVLSTSAAVANVPMHMRTDYAGLRWSLLAFCMVAYTAFLAFLCESLKGKHHRPAYLFFAIFVGVGAIGSRMFADNVEDTVQLILTFGPLALTLTAGLLYLPFRYGFSIGASADGDIEMQTPNGPDRQPGQ